MRACVGKAFVNTVNGSSIGPLAILVGEPGQVRKEAAIVYDVCAGMWLVGLPPKSGSLPRLQKVNLIYR